LNDNAISNKVFGKARNAKGAKYNRAAIAGGHVGLPKIFTNSSGAMLPPEQITPTR
jgi:hypothetical protein